MTYVVPKNNDLPVTLGVLLSFKDELFAKLDARFNRIDAEFKEVRADISGLKADVSDLKSSYHHLTFLTEEQKNQNRIALDGVRHAIEELTGVRERVDKLEEKNSHS